MVREDSWPLGQRRLLYGVAQDLADGRLSSHMQRQSVKSGLQGIPGWSVSQGSLWSLLTPTCRQPLIPKLQGDGGPRCWEPVFWGADLLDHGTAGWLPGVPLALAVADAGAVCRWWRGSRDERPGGGHGTHGRGTPPSPPCSW